MKVDYLIVGQGIAGSILSYLLIKKNKKVIVLNETKQLSSSRTAGGIYNPITGKEMKKTWKADEIFPYLEDFYKKLEDDIEINFLNTVKVFKPFISIEEQNEWMARSALAVYKPYIYEISTKSKFGEFIWDDFGGMEVNFSGFLNVNKFLDGYQEFLKKRNYYLEEVFDKNLLEIKEEEITYKDITAGRIIFCKGPDERFDSFFGWLPYKWVKGELLVIETDRDIPRVFNRGVFILPLGNTQCKVGATYEWKDLTFEKTVKARSELEEKLKILFKKDFKIIDQSAGIRPASNDRRPYIGLHPECKLIGIFNGLGTKGVSLAPHYARQFSEFLEQGIQVDKEVNINRYNSLYFHQKNNNVKAI